MFDFNYTKNELGATWYGMVWYIFHFDITSHPSQEKKYSLEKKQINGKYVLRKTVLIGSTLTAQTC